MEEDNKKKTKSESTYLNRNVKRRRGHSFRYELLKIPARRRRKRGGKKRAQRTHISKIAGMPKTTTSIARTTRQYRSPFRSLPRSAQEISSYCFFFPLLRMCCHNWRALTTAFLPPPPSLLHVSSHFALRPPPSRQFVFSADKTGGRGGARSKQGKEVGRRRSSTARRETKSAAMPMRRRRAFLQNRSLSDVHNSRSATNVPRPPTAAGHGPISAAQSEKNAAPHGQCPAVMT